MESKKFSQVNDLSLLARLGRRNAEAHRHANRFQELFGVPLSRFWDPSMGFDIVRFDETIKPATNQSLRDCIAAKYGTHATQLIESLIRL